MHDLIALVVHAVITPCVIFWASTEARNPAINQFYMIVNKVTNTWASSKEALRNKLKSE